MSDPIKLLAKFMSGPRVANASMDLEMPTRRESAQEYFALREALGVQGWADEEFAEQHIVFALKQAMESRQ